ncbi:MAG: type II toxin-antitoxin system HicA family toxin [Candidatus Acidiferrales bacterium]
MSFSRVGPNQSIERGQIRVSKSRVRQKGSHVCLRHSTDAGRKPLTVPLHKTLKRGLLHRLLRDARITEEQLAEYL